MFKNIKRTHIPLFINQFVNLIDYALIKQDVAIDKLLN